MVISSLLGNKLVFGTCIQRCPSSSLTGCLNEARKIILVYMSKLDWKNTLLWRRTQVRLRRWSDTVVEQLSDWAFTNVIFFVLQHWNLWVRNCYMYWHALTYVNLSSLYGSCVLITTLRCTAIGSFPTSFHNNLLVPGHKIHVNFAPKS